MAWERLKGRFVAVDGPDGCGKTTQARLAAQRLAEQGLEVELFRDPGSTAVGEKIRQLLLNPEHVSLSTETEVLLYMAARVQLWVEKMAPALEKNRCVILDRWLSSTCAYQGYAGGFGADRVLAIAEQCIERPWPDLTVILDVDLDTAGARLKTDLDRMEQKGPDYHQKVRQGFLELARRRRDFTVVDGSGDIEAVHARVMEALSQSGFQSG